MKVMVIVKATRASEAGEMPSEQLLAAMGKYNEELVKAGVMLAGEGLHPSSRGVRIAFNGERRTVIDGPFAETKELIAGFWMWQVNSLQEAIDWAKRCPNPNDGPGMLELRPVFGPEDFGAEFTPELREQEADLRAQTTGLGAVRFENRETFDVVGLRASYTAATRENIPQQWTLLAEKLGKAPGRLGEAYGVITSMRSDGGFDYVAGVSAGTLDSLPADFVTVTLPTRRYAVFTHAGHVSKIGATCSAIWGRWAPDSGMKIAQAPCFERYTTAFNPQTGSGGIEIWVPLES